MHLLLIQGLLKIILKIIVHFSISVEQKQQISLLFSLVQLFIPGPTIVLYGEELALPSGNATGDKKANLVVYPWDNSSIYTTENQFLAVPQRVDNANYAAQMKDENSPVKCFSKVAKLHQVIFCIPSNLM